MDLSRIHRGKKNKGGDFKKLLDDKSDLDSKVPFVPCHASINDIDIFNPSLFSGFWQK